MQTTRINDEVLIAADPIVRVDRRAVADLRDRAQRNVRGRARICAHRSGDDLLHEMLIALRRGSYIRPHRHGGKSESFHVVDGLVDVVIFDDQGRIADVIALGDYASGRSFYYRLADPLFHTVLVRSELAVFHETTNGPFRRADTEFAPWAPEESDPVATAAYQQSLLMVSATGGVLEGAESPPVERAA